MKSSKLASTIAALSFFFVLGCKTVTEDPTSILIQVETDLAPPEVDTGRIYVLASDGAEKSWDQALSASQTPFSVSIFPLRDPKRTLEIHASVLLKNGVVVEQVMTGVTFTPGQSATVKFFLAKSCIGVACVTGQTCKSGLCQTTNIGEIPADGGTTPDGSEADVGFEPDGQTADAPVVSVDASRDAKDSGPVVDSSSPDMTVPAALGTICIAGGQCASGFCIDGVCCDNACTAGCTACNLAGKRGTCSTVAADSVDPRAICKDQAPGVPCGTNGKCDKNGACAFYETSKSCGAAESCSGTTYTPQSFCSGTGTCNNSTPAACPNSLTCDTTRCKGGCTVDQDCGFASLYCDGGTCKTKLPNGTACSAGTANRCTSGNCVDGVCCGSVGCGTCQRCNLNGAGTCSALAAGQPDAHGVCKDQPPCGTNGKCDGNSACAFYSGSTSCGPAELCSGTTHTLPSYCSGSGACNNQSAVTCPGNLVCGGTTCKGACSGDGDCLGGYYCNGGACKAKNPNGTPAPSGNQCTSGLVLDGVCCGSASCASCNSCASGTCAPVSGTDPRNVCSTVCVSGSCGACSPTATRSCAADGKKGTCAGGTETCSGSGTWGACSILPAATDSCAAGNDDSCDGVPYTGCTCGGFKVRSSDANGTFAPVAYDTSVAGVVADKTTGLTWERNLSGRTPGASGCSVGGSGAMTCTQPQAIAYCASLNLGGTGWHVPTSLELATLVDYSVSTTDLVTFPATPRDFFWTSSAVSGMPGYAWAIIFSDGNSYYYETASTKLSVRCVRSNLSWCYPSPRFMVKVASDETLDRMTGLTWQTWTNGANPARSTWDTAKAYCQSKGNGYRLPNIQETQTILDLAKPANGIPLLDVSAFPNSGAATYWTSSPMVSQPGNVWTLDFYYGLSGFIYTGIPYSVRCVR